MEITTSVIQIMILHRNEDMIDALKLYSDGAGADRIGFDEWMAQAYPNPTMRGYSNGTIVVSERYQIDGTTVDGVVPNSGLVETMQQAQRFVIRWK